MGAVGDGSRPLAIGRMDQALFPSARAEAAGRRMRDLRALRGRRVDPSSQQSK